MKYSSFFALFLFFFGLNFLSAQSVYELEARYKKSSSKSEKMDLAYQIAEKSLASNPKKAIDYSVVASQLATEIGDKRKETDASYLAAEAVYRTRNYSDAAGRYNRAWNTARNYGFRDVAVNAMGKLQDIALKQNDYKEALKWSTETVRYLSESSGAGIRSGGEAQKKLENQLAAAEADNRNLREQLAQATGQSQVLENSYQSQLKDVQEKTLNELTVKDQALTQISKEKLRVDSISRTNSLRLKNLTEDQMIDSIVRAQQEREIQVQKRRVAEAELSQEKSEALRKILLLVTSFVMMLAILLYLRFLAKRRMANQLTNKNKSIEEEQVRSNS